ncbi:SRPBCC family protein [Actinomadura latina]|uniref:Polyketide cyclase n=1 Tax=Actinomadura latina TaxID=163603 RepID=A0A846YVR4_9ACTN|nr:SRPBCC family protein [Actinomadura latina]NKZ02173.1 hypothetical protein [Actinomadura latina]
MAPFVNSIEINRSADEVFAYTVEPATFPEWQRDVLDVRVEGRSVGSGRGRAGPAERHRACRAARC